MRIKFRTQCRVPVEGPLLYELEDCELIESLPFQPREGEKLKLTTNGPRMTVEEVSWDCADPKHLLVWFREQDDPKQVPWAAHMQTEGWRVCA